MDQMVEERIPNAPSSSYPRNETVVLSMSSLKVQNLTNSMTSFRSMFMLFSPVCYCLGGIIAFFKVK